jgi:hypothetical protein
MVLGSGKWRLPLAALCLFLAWLFVPCKAEANPPNYYIENLAGRSKLLSGTVSGMLQAYDIFALAINDPQAKNDFAVNAYFAVARVVNRIFRDDGKTDSLIKILKAYDVHLMGDDFDNGSPDAIKLVGPQDDTGTIIFPPDAPSTEAIRVFLSDTLIDEINGAIGNLNVITDPGFKEVIPSLEPGSVPSLEVDYGDIQLLKAGLKALKVFVLVTTAYDLTVDPHFLAVVINSDSGNIRHVLDRFPDLLDWLPTSTTPSAGSSAQLSVAETALAAAIDDYMTASDHIRKDSDTEPGAEELVEFEVCELREETFFRDILSELKRSLNQQNPATLRVYHKEIWEIHDSADPDKKSLSIEFSLDEGEFWSVWPDRVIAWYGWVDCITQNNTTTLYLQFWESGNCSGEAILTATSLTDKTVSGTYAVTYNSGSPSCTGTHTGFFTGSRKIEEELLTVNLNPLFDARFSLRDLLPEFDTYGEPQPGTLGHGIGDDPTLGGVLISLTSEGAVTPASQELWTNELGLQPGGVVTIPTGNISLSDGSVSDWSSIGPVFEDITDDESVDYPGGDVAEFYLARGTDNHLHVRMKLNDDAPWENTWMSYRFTARQRWDGDTPSDMTVLAVWDDLADDWRVIVTRRGEYDSLFDQASGYAQAVGNNLEWKVPSSVVGNLTGRFITAGTHMLSNGDRNQTRLRIGPVITIGGQITGSFSVGTGTVRVGVYKAGRPIVPQHMIDSAWYVRNDVQKPLKYEIQTVPADIPLLILAMWDHDFNGLETPGDLWGAHNGNPVTLTGPRNDLDVMISTDADSDGILDTVENTSACLNVFDADTDDDGIPDGVEDADHNGIVNTGETDPCALDTDADGLQDGTESGYSSGNIGSATDTGVFQADLDPSTTSDPLNPDTDNDGLSDGDEDANHNGRIDPGETDPSRSSRKALHIIPMLLLED